MISPILYRGAKHILSEVFSANRANVTGIDPLQSDFIDDRNHGQLQPPVATVGGKDGTKVSKVSDEELPISSFGIGDYVIAKQSQSGNKMNFETNR